MEKTHSDDKALLSQIYLGNDLAFKQVYHRYSKKVYTFAFRLLRSDTLAEEVMQECMLKVWNVVKNGKDIENLEAYFRTTAKNLSLNTLRKLESESRVKDFGLENWEEGHTDTEEAILLNDARRILEDAINLLPPQQKLVFQLCHQQGLTYEEAATQLGISNKTVAVHMKLALRFVRAYIKKASDLLALLIVFKLL